MTEVAWLPRLLFVVNNAAFFTSHRLPLGLGAIGRGYEVHVACPPSPALDALPAHGFHVHPVPLSRGRNTPGSESRTLRALVRLYRRVKPDIVHHVTVKPVLYGSLAARIAGVPAVVNAVSGLGYLYTTAGAAAWLRRTAVETLYRVALRHPRMRVIFQNADDLHALVSRGLVRGRDAVLVRGSGVDLSAFAAAAEPEGTPPLVVLPARMLWDKGVGDFVEAAKILQGRGVQLRAVLVGDVDPGNPTSVPVARIREWVSSGVVEWWGQRDDMPEVLPASSVVCLPSYREGLPKALLEAAACARPIVATDVPGCREVVVHGTTGRLVPPREPAALADALESLLADPVARSRMGAAARALAEREFSVQRVVSEQLALYRELLPGS